MPRNRPIPFTVSAVPQHEESFVIACPARASLRELMAKVAELEQRCGELQSRLAESAAG
jgi:hypothetical protein